jgi:hypothetical protein
MSLTRASTETILIRRIGRWLTAAGLDGTTISGANLDLADPIAWAIRQSEGTVTSAAVPADADFLTTTASDDRILDLAELRALENAYQNYTDVDLKAGPVEIKGDQLRDGLLAVLQAKRLAVSLQYNIGGSSTISQVPVTYAIPTFDEYSR